MPACRSRLSRIAAVLIALALLVLIPHAALAEDYEGGSIPILNITFHDDVDPETGEVILSGDEKIELVNDSGDHSYKATGVTVDLIVPADYDNPEADMLDGVSGYTGATDLELEFIRGRGNTTWRYDKKPYKLKFDKKTDFFGMGASKHWALLANYKDESLSINRLVGWIGDQMGMPYTPRGVPVDLYLNGVYYGNYLLAEEVRVEASRVDIDEVPEDAAEAPEVTGDYLIGFARKISSLSFEYFETERGNLFSYDTPEYGEPETLTDAQVAQQEYLLSHLNRLEDAIYTKDLVSDSGESLWDIMDMASLADYWWMQEFTTNRDAYATPSTYIYKLRDTVAADGTVVTGKTFWGPLWDFDIVWGQLDVEGLDNTYHEWTSLMRQDPAFVALLEERWHVLDGILEEVTREGGLLDGYIAEMSESWQANRDYSTWEHMHDWAADDYATAIEELRTHIDARRAWINAHLDELPTTFFSIAFMDGDEKVTEFLVKEGDPCWEDEPAAPAKDGFIFEGWFAEDGEQYESGSKYTQDMVFQARYIDSSTVTAADQIFVASDELWITRAKPIIFEVYPSDAQDQRIVWSSSDENVVTVTEDGFVIPTQGCLDESDTAEAIVTARLVGTGAEVQIRVVVYNQFAIDIPEPDSIEFEGDVELAVDELRQLAWTAEPSPNRIDANFDLSFSSADEGIATVSEAGVVTGIAPGTTTITVSRPNPDTYEQEVVAEVEITVGEPAPDPEPETFSITISLNGGTLNGSTADIVMACKKGDTITLPAAPTREGYTFLYWKGSEYQPGDTYTVTEDHTFTAEWKADEKPAPTPTPTPTPQPPAPKPIPKTGDENPQVLAVALVGAVLVGAYALRYARSASRFSKQS